MFILLLILNVIVATAMIGCILLQRSEGGAIGIGGGNIGAVRAPADPLTRVTAYLGAAFIALSLLLTVVARQQNQPDSLIDAVEKEAATRPASSAPASPVDSLIPTAPSIPLDR